MKNIFIASALLCAILCISGCSEDETTETMVEVTDPDETTNPIPDQITTYSGEVKTIIDTKCTNCHGNPRREGAPIFLISYADVTEAVENSDLLGRLKSTNRVMPPSGKIEDASILLVEDWIADGLKN